MPELPEVETIKRGLSKNIVGKTISEFDSDWKKNINYPLKKYKEKVKGLKIKQVKRRAKMLILKLSKGWNVLIHLKMTGQLVFSSKSKCVIGGHPIEEGFDCLPNKFTHALFKFKDGSYLFFNDVRKFGWLRLYTDKELAEILVNMQLGPEPLEKDFTLKYLKQKMKSRPNTKIKPFLMDNKVLVGVGNIYSDEVCYYAKVRPDRVLKNITAKETELIYKGIIKILNDSIKAQGTTFRDFRDADGESGGYSKELKVYGRAGESCYKCRGQIKKMKLGGRSSSFCPICQK